MSSTTLRQVSGLDDTPATLADSTLVFIDYQNTYTTGVMELTGWAAALESAADLLARAREAGATVIHVQHDSGEGSPYDLTQEIGQIHKAVAPIEGEAVVTKQAPNSFVGTNLEELLDEAGNDSVVIGGFMTHMCVSYTSEGAFLRGKQVTVVADACATRPLASAAGEVSAEQLHASALATINDIYGVVVPNADALN